MNMIYDGVRRHGKLGESDLVAPLERVGIGGADCSHLFASWLRSVKGRQSTKQITHKVVRRGVYPIVPRLQPRLHLLMTLFLLLVLLTQELLHEPL
jgi:hypothetical protein